MGNTPVTEKLLEIRLRSLRTQEETARKNRIRRKVHELLPGFLQKYSTMIRSQQGSLENGRVDAIWRDHTRLIAKTEGPEVLAALNEALGIREG